MKGRLEKKRRQTYELIRKTGEDEALSYYDYFIILAIVVSLIPLAFREETVLFRIIDKITVVIFIVDYFLHWATADFRFGRKGWKTFAQYPFGKLAIVDLLSILPSLTVVNNAIKLLRIVRLGRAMRVVRVFKAFRYSKNLDLIWNVIKITKDSLLAVYLLAAGYIVVSALVIYNVEPETFPTFFDAIYWATVSLTTVGYGDIYPVSTIGRVITMISSLTGVAVVALPAGIFTAGFMTELQRTRRTSREQNAKQQKK